MFDIMSILGFKKEKPKTGVYLFSVFILMQVLIFILSWTSTGYLSGSSVFNLLFNISISILCIRGFLYENNKLIEVGATVLFIYAGVNGFIAIGNTNFTSGDALYVLNNIFNFLLNILSAAAFSLYLAIWIRYDDLLAKLEKIFLMSSCLIAIIIFIIQLVICFQNFDAGASNSSLIFAIAFNNVGVIALYPAISFAFYYIDR